MTVTARSTFQFLSKDRSIPQTVRSGVSLHSHTMYSEESLEMVPRYTAKTPYLGNAIRRQEAIYSRKKNKSFQFGDAFWTPPLSPRQAYRVEEKQIQRQLHLPALVSLTDHDDIRAGSQLSLLDRFKRMPISTEWTIPFRETFFHLGIHNLPAAESAHWMERLREYTRAPEDAMLAKLLEDLNRHPSALVVLNHPLWDEKGIGAANHRRDLNELLAGYGPWFHALELNGLRSWAENQQVIALARQLNIPSISGGDRHGREANAILNLSSASDFSEFVNEIRYERKSHVIFMPQYEEPLKLRVLQTMVDVVRDYPENFAGRRSWGDRVFYRDPETQAVTPLASIWTDGGPSIVKHFITAMRLLEWRPMRSALRVFLNDRATIWSDKAVI